LGKRDCREPERGIKCITSYVRLVAGLSMFAVPYQIEGVVGAYSVLLNERIRTGGVRMLSDDHRLLLAGELVWARFCYLAGVFRPA